MYEKSVLIKKIFPPSFMYFVLLHSSRRMITSTCISHTYRHIRKKIGLLVIVPLLGRTPNKDKEPYQPCVVTLIGVAKGSLTLAKGAALDSGGRECPYFRSWVRQGLSCP